LSALRLGVDCLRPSESNGDEQKGTHPASQVKGSGSLVQEENADSSKAAVSDLFYSKQRDDEDDPANYFFVDEVSRTVMRGSPFTSEQRNVIHYKKSVPYDIAMRKDKIYLTASKAGRIITSDLDGQELEEIMVGKALKPGPVAVDDAVKYIFWAELQNGSIVRANLEDEKDFQTIALGVGHVTGLALDGDDVKVYWSTDELIQRSNLDGSQLENVIKDLNGTKSLAIDGENNVLYWFDTGSNTLQRAYTSGEGQQTVDDGFIEPAGVAVTSGGDVLFADKGANVIYMNSNDCIIARASVVAIAADPSATPKKGRKPMCVDAKAITDARNGASRLAMPGWQLAPVFALLTSLMSSRFA